MKDELTSEKRYGVQNRPIHYQYLCHSDLCFESIEQYKKNIGNLFYKTQAGASPETTNFQATPLKQLKIFDKYLIKFYVQEN